MAEKRLKHRSLLEFSHGEPGHRKIRAALLCSFVCGNFGCRERKRPYSYVSAKLPRHPSTQIKRAQREDRFSC